MYLVNCMILLIYFFSQSSAQVTMWDRLFAPYMRAVKDVVLNELTKNPEHLQNANGLGKLQRKVRDDVQFPCDLHDTKSEEPATSVHRLRPGDIDVIAAIGDSLTAGNGLLATNVFHVFQENRGISLITGGQKTWREYLSVANILKEFNPNLTGFSVADGFGHHIQATRLNVAEPGAISKDLPYMAQLLVKRMQSDPNVDVEKHWKIISLMIGSNDFCGDMCYHENPEEILENHRRDLLIALRVLRDNIPRSIVTVILQPNLKILANSTRSNRPAICYVMHNILCPCLFGVQFEKMQEKFEQIMIKWQKIELEVCNDPEFDRDNFTVVIQPFTMHYELHRTSDGLSDYSVFSQDCFHLSQKEGARAALSLWNNILEPVGKKSTRASELFDIKCPSRDQPYIFTKRNSFN